MPLVNFTQLDFDQIKTTLRDYLRANSNFTDYDFEGSNLSTILNTLAYNTYITSYQANMMANEAFLDSATLRENVISLARNIGYVPRSRKSSSATISFFVNTENIQPAPAALTLRKGVVASTTGSFGNQSFVFSILNDITVPVVNNIANFSSIPIHEGIVLNSSFTYDANNSNQKFILSNSGIDTDLISVSVKETQQSSTSVSYVLQDNLFEIDSNSEIYFLQEIHNEQYELIFGDGIFGKALNQGNFIEISYIVSNGDSANGISQFLFSGNIVYNRNSQNYSVTSGISLLTTDSGSSGGENIESIESIRKYAPRIYSSQNRALTVRDYETLIPSKIYTDTESISVFGGEDLVPPQYGKVFISIKPRTGDFIPNLVKQNIKNQLKKYAVAGIVPEILDLKYLYIETHSKIYYNSNLAPSADSVSSLAQSNALKYAESTEMNKFGARFKYSKFLKILDDSSSAITSNITTIQIRRDLRIVPSALAEYSIGFGNAFHISNMNGFNVRSSSFRIADYQQDLYLSDLPNSNGQTGSIFFFTNASNPTIVKRNVGTINYTNGIITLNPVNIISTNRIRNGQNIVEISVIPNSNDVIGLQDLYLQLDINNSIFETIMDEISSGSSGYIVSSSYFTENLVRS